jgi:hypothetical protein
MISAPSPGTAAVALLSSSQRPTVVHDPRRGGRRTVLHLSAHAPWARLLLAAVTRLRALAALG